MSADLNQQPWFKARGRLEGRAIVLPGGQDFPLIWYSVAGTNVELPVHLESLGLAMTSTNREASGSANAMLATTTFALDGNLRWPSLEVSNAVATIRDGSTAQASGSFDFNTGRIAAGRLSYSGEFGRQFLPAGYAFERARLEAEISGPLRGPRHAGNLEVVGAIIAGAGPMHVVAAWEGDGARLQATNVVLSTTNSRITLSGSADVAPEEKVIAVDSLSIQTTNRPELKLDAPFRVAWHKSGAAGSVPGNMGSACGPGSFGWRHPRTGN